MPGILNRPINPPAPVSANPTQEEIQSLIEQGYNPEQIQEGVQQAQTKAADAKKAQTAKTKKISSEVAAADKLLGITPSKSGTAASTNQQTYDQQTLEQQAQAAGIWQQLGQGLVNAQSNLELPVEQAISGGLTASGDSTAEQTALAAIGLSPTDSAAKWLLGQIKQGEKNDDPLMKAMQAYGAAYASGESGVNAALANMGQANAEMIQTAPEADWINSLAQHIMSNVNYYGQIPTALVGTLPPALQWALSQSGAGGTTTSGVVPLSNLAAGLNKNLEPPPAKGSNTSALNLPSITGAAAGSTPATVPPDVSNGVTG